MNDHNNISVDYDSHHRKNSSSGAGSTISIGTGIGGQDPPAKLVGTLADIHALVEKLQHLLDEEESDAISEAEEALIANVDGDRTSNQHRLDLGLGRRRRQKVLREKELRQCLRKLHTIFQNEEFHRLLAEINDVDSNSRSCDDGDNDDYDEVVVELQRDDNPQGCRHRHQHDQHRRRQHGQQRHELLLGLTDDCVNLMTLSCVSRCDDPSVIQLWKTLLPYPAVVLPTCYLNTDQIWVVFVRVLETIHDFDVRISQYLYDQENKTGINVKNHDVDFPAYSNLWPPAEADREAFKGLLGQLLGALELNPSYFEGILPTNEADEVLLRPIQLLCRLTRLEQSQQGTAAASINRGRGETIGGLLSSQVSSKGTSSHKHQNCGSDEDHPNYYGGLPLELVVSLRVLVDHFLTNLKNAVLHESEVQRQAVKGFLVTTTKTTTPPRATTSLSLCEWSYQKKNNQNYADKLSQTSTPSSPSSMLNSQGHWSAATSCGLPDTDHDFHHFSTFLDEYAMDLADQAIQHLHDVETLVEDAETRHSDPSFERMDMVGTNVDGKNGMIPHEYVEIIVDALQYARLASNFFFQTEHDGFYQSVQLQGLSRSLWHAVGEFTLLIMEVGMRHDITGPILSPEWEATLTETLFRLTQTQVSLASGSSAESTSSSTMTSPTRSSDQFEDKELTFVVATIVRVLDHTARDICSDEEMIKWVEHLLKRSTFGHKLVLPLQAALLSAVYISGTHEAAKKDWLVSSLLQLTGLSKDGGSDIPPSQFDGQVETVNDVWKGYVSDQIYGNRM